MSDIERHRRRVGGEVERVDPAAANEGMRPDTADERVIAAAALEDRDAGELSDADRGAAEIVVGQAGRGSEEYRRRGRGIVERVHSAAADKEVIAGPADEDIVAAAALEDRDAGELIDADRGAAEVVVGQAGRKSEVYRRRGGGIVERVQSAAA